MESLVAAIAKNQQLVGAIFLALANFTLDAVGRSLPVQRPFEDVETQKQLVQQHG